jgi:hypothetical protein
MNEPRISLAFRALRVVTPPGFEPGTNGLKVNGIGCAMSIVTCRKPVITAIYTIAKCIEYYQTF